MSSRAALALSVPTQHGAWATLAASYLIGALALSNPSIETLLIAVPIVCAFLGRQAVARRRRLPAGDSRRRSLVGWASCYAVVSLLVTCLLALEFDRWLLFPLGAGAVGLIALSLALEWRRVDRTTLGELIGMAGLSAALPATVYAATGMLTAPTAALWVVTSLFFGGSVFRVRYLVRKRLAGPAVLYHLAIVAATAAAEYARVIPRWELVALVPSAVAMVWIVGRRAEEQVPIRRIGFEELGHTLLFIAITLTVYRTQIPGGFLE